ncbi:MAG: S24 family peptidase [Nitrospiraceae bacterium]
MELRRLLYKELSEGFDEEELGASIGVSPETIKLILAGGIPKDPETWKKCAAYFHVNLDALRFGEESNLPAPLETLLSPNPVIETVRYRKVPLLSWSKVGRITRRSDGPVEKLAQTMVETDVLGSRVFALRVRNDAMEPLFHKGEVIFVNPDLTPSTNHYVVVLINEKGAMEAKLRQLKKLGKQVWFHALNPKYADSPLTKHHRIVGQ